MGVKRLKEANLLKIKLRRIGSQKVVVGINIDDIGYLEDLRIVVFINEECGNIKVVVERLLEILTKKRSQMCYRSIHLHSVTNIVGEGIFSICKWNIVN